MQITKETNAQQNRLLRAKTWIRNNLRTVPSPTHFVPPNPHPTHPPLPPAPYPWVRQLTIIFCIGTSQIYAQTLCTGQRITKKSLQLINGRQAKRQAGRQAGTICIFSPVSFTSFNASRIREFRKGKCFWKGECFQTSLLSCELESDD